MWAGEEGLGADSCHFSSLVEAQWLPLSAHTPSPQEFTGTELMSPVTYQGLLGIRVIDVVTQPARVTFAKEDREK